MDRAHHCQRRSGNEVASLSEAITSLRLMESMELHRFIPEKQHTGFHPTSLR